MTTWSLNCFKVKLAIQLAFIVTLASGNISKVHHKVGYESITQIAPMQYNIKTNRKNVIVHTHVFIIPNLTKCSLIKPFSPSSYKRPQGAETYDLQKWKHVTLNKNIVYMNQNNNMWWLNVHYPKSTKIKIVNIDWKLKCH